MITESAALTYWKNNTPDEFGGYVPDSYDEIEFLRSYDPSKFPIITSTVDMVVLSEDSDVDHVLLILRRNYPYKDHWALPGGFIDPLEATKDAALRELQEEAGLSLDPEAVDFVVVADAPHRDPRGRCLSMVYTTRVNGRPDVYAGDDATHALWWPLDKVRDLDMAFDHKELLWVACLKESVESPFHRGGVNP